MFQTERPRRLCEIFKSEYKLYVLCNQCDDTLTACNAGEKYVTGLGNRFLLKVNHPPPPPPLKDKRSTPNH